jgi:hypothetical protein
MPVGGVDAAGVGTTADVEGASVSGSVARPLAASPEGSTSGPFWPQADSSKALQAASAVRRAKGLTRIWRTPDIWKL